MKKKIVVVILLSVFVLFACGVEEPKVNTSIMDNTMLRQEVAEIDSTQVSAEESVTEQKRETKVIGGSNVVKDDKIVDQGGILAQLSSLVDNLDMDEIERLSDEEKQKLVGGLDVLKQRQNMMVQDISAALADTGVEVDTQSGKITMDENILFGKNEDFVSEEGKAYLDTFFGLYAKSILDGGNSGYISEIQVIGNTDTDGTYEYNMDLSKRRAEAVVDYCLFSSGNNLSDQEKEQMKALMVAVGNSYDDPVYDAAGNIDMEASRRVEFKFIMNLD